MDAQAPIVGQPAPDFTLTDQQGGPVKLSDICRAAPALLAFYPSDFTAVCTKQLCGYSDHMSEFAELDIQILGISRNPTASHARFASQYGFGFKLLSDPDHEVAKLYGCTSRLMFGSVSRGCFIVNRDRTLVYRHVEPTPITHRSAKELLGVVADLRAKGLI